MKITTHHSKSCFGVPVILDGRGRVMDYPAGFKAFRRKFNLSTTELAALCGVSRRTVEGWEQGKPPSAAALNVMADRLSKPS